ncbi:type I glyceraldehyde-3-phosphate dehydrogenase [Alkalimarinus coralli]|uniref:type I glyceraldehyde-3-phosphate dehydrogenase n=1 Tax=Alkalimarinus coralli TaxID=2935863 RepID=UPI00202B09F5|nr:type I glyceraldehyde-3-phosphate dehydrogenase [Alkalimarinus coralli]
MTIRVAINGFGRIGRNIVRALYENDYRDRIQVVAINDLADVASNAHLLKHDSVHGHFAEKVSHDGSHIFVGSDEIDVYSSKDPSELPWSELNIDVVYECTGLFTSRDAAAKHLNAGARKVIISAPGKGVDATVVYGVNDQVLNHSHHIISNASCTTNCLAPVAQVLERNIGIVSGLMTTVHAVTNDQNLTDVYHPDLYRARSAMQSMIPTKTGAAAAIGLVLPELKGKFDGLAVRVPVVNVSVVDLSLVMERETTVEEVNQLLKDASEKSDVLAYNDLQWVSTDYNHHSASSIFDANQTRVIGRHVKVMSWYDNEWGFSNRMLDNTLALIKASR